VTGVAIVAIPRDDEYVWRISSEKVPHMTILYLGDNVENLDRIATYLQHVASSSLYEFGVEVDRRGTLGDQSADVLFFTKRDTKMMEDARAYLLQDPDIYRAYHSTEQYPSWTPHLTLGYPATPAKPLVQKDDYTRTMSWVFFDRIALWVGDYEGPEFRLKDRYASEEVRMSELAHYGVKGMKWGVRKEDVTRVGKLAKTASYKTNKTQAEYQQAITKAGGLHNMSTKQLEDMRKRLELEKKLRDVINEDAKKRAEKRMAALKILGEVGKIALPIIIGAAVNQKFNSSRDPFRTNAFVSRNVIDIPRKAIGS
jgi:2'-5' RNA ligase